VKYDNDSYNGGTTLISLSGKAEEYISSKALDSHTDDPLQAIYEMPQERMVEAIRSMLHTLSRMSSRRQNIFLHRLAGMSYPEICREVGISLRAVHRHYHIALEKIMETTRKD
jgi:DNA-directed RNA polymerase specialized sigma24 family protein